MNKKQIALIVLDGWGHREKGEHNAIDEAQTPFFDSLWRDYPHSTLDASEEYVGLPSGQIGNSEIGHMTMGAGRVIDTDLVRITKFMNALEFSSNTAFKKAFDHVKENNSVLHLMGLVSPGGIHSHDSHLYGLIRSAKESGVKRVAIHAFTDGRDTPPQSAKKYLENLEKTCEDLGIGFIATVSGRFYAMDRDNNWDRMEKAKQAIFSGVPHIEKNKKASVFVGECYEKGQIDEHLEPIVFLDSDDKPCVVSENDGVIIFNFRPDRVRQLAKIIEEIQQQKNICFVTMTEYEKNTKAYVAFSPMSIDATLAGEISKIGMTQVHIAETEKYPHATYFINGGREEPHVGEEHIMIESRKDVPTHDLAPEMRAKEIADVAINKIMEGKDFIFINFANADMVGHTANKDAIVIAVETVDRELGRVHAALVAKKGVAVVTADHGNAEMNIDPITGEKHTAHTLSKVPIIITQKGLELHEGTLADIAPTILSLYNLSIPECMTGKKLF